MHAVAQWATATMYFLSFRAVMFRFESCTVWHFLTFWLLETLTCVLLLGLKCEVFVWRRFAILPDGHGGIVSFLGFVIKFYSRPASKRTSVIKTEKPLGYWERYSLGYAISLYLATLRHTNCGRKVTVNMFFVLAYVVKSVLLSRVRKRVEKHGTCIWPSPGNRL